MNKKNSINYAVMGKITKQLKAGLKEKYKLLEDISKDLNSINKEILQLTKEIKDE